MKVFFKAPDGGASSGVTGYFLIECKRLFSVVLLHFSEGSREAFHNHAFDAVTVWLKGEVEEHDLRPSVPPRRWRAGSVKFTPWGKFHKIVGIRSAWALSVRGPWRSTWMEFRQGRYATLTHGRIEVDQKGEAS